ncbi:MAG: TIGR02099 family protein, partial [Psychromonas sp.]|nr:TIGR02099 family protein [Psychromonas sp.]
GVWDLLQLTHTLPQLAPLQLSGKLDWSGNVKFEQGFSGGYQSRVVLNSATQGVTTALPFPFNKNALQSWPTTVAISSNQKSSTFTFNIKNKLDFIGELDYQHNKPSIPYFAVNIGADKLTDIDTQKHVVKITQKQLNIGDWYKYWNKVNKQGIGSPANQNFPSLEPDRVLVDIKHATLFGQPLAAFKIDALNDKQKWSAAISSDNLQGTVEQRFGVPNRFDFDVQKLNFQSMDLSALHTADEPVSGSQMQQSDNLREDYPEIFVKCASCIYGDYDFSPLELHLFPDKRRLNIDYINIGTKDEFVHLSGLWDQRSTNMIIDSVADKNNSIVKRLGFGSPVVYEQAQLSGAFNWIGAPWQFNLASLNGEFSASLENGSITEVSDKGARLLSFFSLDGIRRSLNLEFNNVFAKGLNFDELTLSAKITDGIVKNDDFYLNGSAGKITGSGLLDLANKNTNYKFSYSPAVTSSLPVLTAFAINPLTGAAVLFLTKILEPVVDTIVRVDFSVKGPLNNPEVKLISRQQGKVNLQNSEVLEKINKLQLKENNGGTNEQ